MMRYVLITPARNEGENIGRTLASVVSQVHKPLKWVVVSDGSTDQTDDVVSAYLQEHDWIQLIRMPERRERSFAAKVDCFNAGLRAVGDLEFDVIGNLDADLSFAPDYFAFLMARFAEEPRLGVAGTPFVENGAHYDYRFTNIEHVSGACQLFRRDCFADIGGYVPIKGGGIDWVAVTTARMKGWQTRTFTEKSCVHHRPMGTSSAGRLLGAFRQGRKDYYLGGHPIWQIFRSLYQLARPPYVVGGASMMVGYSWAWMQRQERPVSTQLIRFHRHEQMTRLRRLLVPSIERPLGVKRAAAGTNSNGQNI
jgi:glycosyltransferase involved in cell wall biosynthesis